MQDTDLRKLMVTVKSILHDAVDDVYSKLCAAVDDTDKSTIKPVNKDQTAKPTNKDQAVKPPKPLQTKAKSLPKQNLGEIPKFDSEQWPQAISPSMNVSDKGDPEKRYRALQILGTIGVPMAKKRILDFGCGEGHVAEKLAEQAEYVTAYDIAAHTRWSDGENHTFSTEKSIISNNAPYDLIVAYDVFDHLMGEDPVEVLKILANSLSESGVMFVRTHPWTSKHGGHLYEQFNKAYLHLALTPDELISNGIKFQHNLKVSRPMAVYEKWYADSGLRIIEKRIKTEKPAEFFNGPILDRIIKVTWGGSIDKEQALKIMANQFIDYVLTRNEKA